MEDQIVVLEAGFEYYGVDISKVESILKMQPVTRLTYAPEYVQGVTHLRDRVLPVINLRKRLGRPDNETARDSRIVVVRCEQAELSMGMIVNGISEVLTGLEGAVEDASISLSGSVDPSFYKGVLRVGRRQVMLLDLEKVLSIVEQ